jgi:hypothetical protein
MNACTDRGDTGQIIAPPRNEGLIEEYLSQNEPCLLLVTAICLNDDRRGISGLTHWLALGQLKTEATNNGP